MSNSLHHEVEPASTGSIVDHIEHIEDLPVLFGYEGALLARHYLGSCYSALYGGLYDARISTKFDGSFSIVAGYDPLDEQFFVAKKSIFNKVPVYYKSGEQITNSNLRHDLKVKLLWSLQFLPAIIKEGIFQGDFLYDLHEAKPEFQPNTLLYAPRTKKISDQIADSFIGIAWHTQYVGMIGNLSVTTKYKFPESNINVLSIDSTWTPTDLNTTREFYRAANLFLRDIDLVISKLQRELNGFAAHPELPKLFKQYQNARAKGCEYGFKYWLDKYFKTEHQARKTARGMKAVLERWVSVDAALDEFNMIDVRTLVLMIEELKRRLLVEFDKRSNDWSVYYVTKHDNHLHPTGHEGYVISKSDGRFPVKLVDRKQFSSLNFSSEIKHGWER